VQISHTSRQLVQYIAAVESSRLFQHCERIQTAAGLNTNVYVSDIVCLAGRNVESVVVGVIGGCQQPVVVAGRNVDSVVVGVIGGCQQPVVVAGRGYGVSTHERIDSTRSARTDSYHHTTGTL